MDDQARLRAIGVAVARLADDPYPAGAFHRGDYHRLRVGQSRVVYIVDDDLITVERVDRVHRPKTPGCSEDYLAD